MITEMKCGLEQNNACRRRICWLHKLHGTRFHLHYDHTAQTGLEVRTRLLWACLAQLVEQLSRKQQVVGSRPTASPTNFKHIPKR